MLGLGLVLLNTEGTIRIDTTGEVIHHGEHSYLYACIYTLPLLEDLEVDFHNP